MTDPLALPSALIIWRKFIEWDWDKTVASIPERLRIAASGAHDIGAGHLRHDLGAFALVRPVETGAQFGVLACTVDAAVASRKLTVGEDKPVDASDVAVASLGNMFECLGFPIADATWNTMRAWLPRFDVSRNDQRVFDFWNAGLMAIALGERAAARRFAGHRGDGAIPFEPGATFQMNLRGFIAHLVGAVEAGAPAADVMPAFLEFLGNYRRYASGDAADDSMLFWVGRIVHHQLGGNPLGTTAQFLHDTIWKLAGEPPIHRPPGSNDE